MLTLATAAILSLSQAASEPASVLAEGGYTIPAEQWELSYDVTMLPYVEDYKRCLGYGMRRFDGTPNIEAQHRADIPRCAPEKTNAIADSNAALQRRGRDGAMTPADVERVFATLDSIHIERGRNFDDRFQLQVRAAQERQRRYAEQIAERDAALARMQAENPSSTDNNNAQN